MKRKAKREQRRRNFTKQYDDFSVLCNRQNLYDAADLAKKHVMWKGTVQRWSIEQLLWTEKLYRDLKAGKDVRKGFSRFTICERGKSRNISAVRFYERVVQKCICQKVLYPVYSKSLIYDNTASQKDKGVKFAADRLITALRRYYKKYGSKYTYSCKNIAQIHAPNVDGRLSLYRNGNRHGIHFPFPQAA